MKNPNENYVKVLEKFQRLCCNLKKRIKLNRKIEFIFLVEKKFMPQKKSKTNFFLRRSFLCLTKKLKEVFK